MITVVNKRQGIPGEYIGRPSALGNPFVIGRDGTRDEVIAKYREWLKAELAKDFGGDIPCTRVQDEYYALAKHAASRDLTLVCWCAPQACHGDVLKEFLERDTRHVWCVAHGIE